MFRFSVGERAGADLNLMGLTCGGILIRGSNLTPLVCGGIPIRGSGAGLTRFGGGGGIGLPFHSGGCLGAGLMGLGGGGGTSLPFHIGGTTCLGFGGGGVHLMGLGSGGCLGAGFFAAIVLPPLYLSGARDLSNIIMLPLSP